jgi:mannose-6-phosphate isomerase-like protein (cupin superfamily)
MRSAFSGLAVAVDLADLVQASNGRGPVWTCETDDLDVNLLVFGPGEGVAEHVNREVDVLLVGVAGSGTVRVDGATHTLAAGTLVIVPKGTRRAIQSASDRFAYLSCHRRRRRLMPQPSGVSTTTGS